MQRDASEMYQKEEDDVHAGKRGKSAQGKKNHNSHALQALVTIKTTGYISLFLYKCSISCVLP